MRLLLNRFGSIILLILLAGCQSGKINIEKTSSPNGREYYAIRTKSCSYLYDIRGGGFSSILDKDSIEWIGYSPDSDIYPGSAATSFRGLPDLVFGSDDNGVGHPGFNKCVSTLEDSNRIHTVSNSGKWEWTWTFHENYAVMHIIKTDSACPYWFLYEGISGGEFQPYRQYWGTSLGGPWNDIPDYYFHESFIHPFQWIYFGNEKLDRVFFMAQVEPDDKQDIFAYLGNSNEGVISPNGMVVAGFGRTEGPKALLAKPGLHFIIGFYDEKIISPEIHRKIGDYIEKLIRQIQ